MSMFPGAGAEVYRNEAGEPIGWDYPSEPEYDPDDYLPVDEDDDETEDEVDEQEQTWPDLDGRCEDLIREAFSVLNEAPGYRRKYERVQACLAQATRILRGTE